MKDISVENAERGKAYAAASYEKNRRVSEEQAQQYLARVTATDDYGALADCDLVIEAVFENRDVKAAVTKETEAVLADTAGFCLQYLRSADNRIGGRIGAPGQFYRHALLQPSGKNAPGRDHLR